MLTEKSVQIRNIRGIRVLLLLTTVGMLRLLTTVDTEECTEEHRDRAL